MPQIDDDERTNSMGLFNTAEAYRVAAETLHEHNVGSGHAEKPVRFLYCHALELYLKALLRQHHNVGTITKNFRHNMRRLLKAAEAFGLIVSDEDRNLLIFIEDTDAALETRYIKTGSKTWPTLDGLRTSVALRLIGGKRRFPVCTAAAGRMLSAGGAHSLFR